MPTQGMKYQRLGNSPLRLEGNAQGSLLEYLRDSNVQYVKDSEKVILIIETISRKPLF